MNAKDNILLSIQQLIANKKAMIDTCVDVDDKKALEECNLYISECKSIYAKIANEDESESKGCHIDGVSGCFSFAKYLNDYFTYFDNTHIGDVYTHITKQGVFSEQDIYNMWLNNR